MAGKQQETDFPAGLGAPARRALASAGINSLADLSELSEEAIRALHGIGPKAIALLRRALASQELSFADHGNVKQPASNSTKQFR